MDNCIGFLKTCIYIHTIRKQCVMTDVHGSMERTHGGEDANEQRLSVLESSYAIGLGAQLHNSGDP
jgi:hypothetical protein